MPAMLFSTVLSYTPTQGKMLYAPAYSRLLILSCSPLSKEVDADFVLL